MDFFQDFFLQIVLSIFSRCPAGIHCWLAVLLPSGILSGMSGTFSNHYRERKRMRGWAVGRGREKKKADVCLFFCCGLYSVSQNMRECVQFFVCELKGILNWLARVRWLVFQCGWSI